MWKRIQTLYIAIALVLTGSMFFLRLATVIGPGGDETGIFYHEKMPYLILITMSFIAHVAAIASFKVRMLQARVCVLAALLLAGFQIWLGVDFLKYRTDMVFSFTMLFPLPAIFFDILAARSAMVDEVMVHAGRRIRK